MGEIKRQWIWRIPGRGWVIEDDESSVTHSAKIDGQWVETEVLEITNLRRPFEQCAAIADEVAANNKGGSTPEARACYVVATEIAKYIRELQPQAPKPSATVEIAGVIDDELSASLGDMLDREKLWQHVQTFVTDQSISCEETVYQSDRVIENGYEFIAGCCKIVGYLPSEGDYE
ncbi:hypothetical protein [Pararhizobium qamdonense]|uniref:hypothetical protein n=1 Tax=Pararhizobium qamdonense TaxID=3031126 RepID=UPI0023E2EAD2|nr:hypothetical protein [Pararhizobium qamdonense]